MFSEFRAFLTKTNALALAIGVIIGGALGNVVGSLVDDIIMPPIGVLLGGVKFTDLKWPIKDNGLPTEVAINIGNFVQVLIVFVVVAFVVFMIAKALIKEEPAAPAEPSDEVKLLGEIRDALRKG